jgi:hypothetical protein
MGLEVGESCRTQHKENISRQAMDAAADVSMIKV